jgi:hypothetical protein
MTPALFSGACDVDWKPLSRSGSGSDVTSGPRANGRLIVRVILSALDLYCDAQRMLE